MSAKRLSAKALLCAPLLVSASVLTSTAFSQEASSKIEFRSTTAPVVISGSPMARREEYHTDTEMIGFFDAPPGLVICRLTLRNLVMVAGKTTPSFSMNLWEGAKSIRYGVANGTSAEGPFGMGHHVNPKPTGEVTVEFVPETADRSACRTPGEV
jgi:hypothetical protein